MNLFLILLLLLFNCQYGIKINESAIKGNKTFRTWSGHVFDITEAPYIVAIYGKLFEEIYMMCTGSIIHPQWILTAAHCLKDVVEEWGIVYGQNFAPPEPFVEMKSVIKIIKHPNYFHGREENLLNDIALIVMKEIIPMQLNGKTSVIQIEGHTWPKYQNQYLSRKCTALGFGENFKYDHLLRGTTFIAKRGPNSCECGVTNLDKICARGINDASCYGDSGSPLICDNKIVGVLSAAEICGIDISNECNENYEEHYLYLCPYIEWLNKYVPNITGKCEENFIPIKMVIFKEKLIERNAMATYSVTIFTIDQTIFISLLILFLFQYNNF